MLVLFDGFNAHFLSGEQRLVARGIAGRWHELKVTMTTTEEEPSPEVTQTESVSTASDTFFYILLKFCFYDNRTSIFLRVIIKKTLI